MSHLFSLLICFVILQSSGDQWFIQGVPGVEFNEADGNPIAELPIETKYQYLRNLRLKIYAMNVSISSWYYFMRKFFFIITFVSSTLL